MASRKLLSIGNLAAPMEAPAPRMSIVPLKNLLLLSFIPLWNEKLSGSGHAVRWSELLEPFILYARSDFRPPVLRIINI